MLTPEQQKLVDAFNARNAAFLDSVREHFNIPTREAWSALPLADRYGMMGEYMHLTENAH